MGCVLPLLWLPLCLTVCVRERQERMEGNRAGNRYERCFCCRER